MTVGRELTDPRPVSARSDREEHMSERPWAGGDRIAERYELDVVLGRGGFGEVWRALDTKRDEAVAIKVLVRRDGVGDDEHAQQRDRFLAEARETGRLNGGPHIISVFDSDEHDGRPFIVMNCHEGQSLADLLSEGGPLDPVRSAAIVGQIAEALDYAHGHDRVHRDVKPSNVLVRSVRSGAGRKDHVSVVDFGLIGAIGGAAWSRMTQTGTVVGSMPYMAPERFPIGPDPTVPEPDERLDVYGLACVLHECLTGRLAFRSTGLFELIGEHQWASRPRPSTVTPSLAAFDDVVVRGLAVDPADRIRYADDFRRQVDAALERWRAEQVEDVVPVPDEPVPAARDTTDPPPVPPAPTAPRRTEAPTEAPRPVARDTALVRDSALTGGAVVGIAGSLVGLAAGTGLPATAALIVGSWLAGTVAGGWLGRVRGRRRGSSTSASGVSDTEH